MTTKQVKSAAKGNAPASSNSQRSNLYVSVNTFDADTGKTVGERIVDQYHFGTRNWQGNHIWWAMHQGHTVEIKPANADEIAAYIASQTAALAEKHNATPPATAENVVDKVAA